MNSAAETLADASAQEASRSLEQRCQQLRADALDLLDALGEVVVGQPEVLRQVLIAVLGGGHALIEGAPGLAKTLLVKGMARCLGLQAGRIQFTPDLLPADITGTLTLVPGEQGPGALRFEPGPIFANLVLCDEINRATPRTQSALLEAMEERQVTSAGSTHPLPDPFCVLATQNPLENEGTYPLPEAQQDRFLVKVRVPAPDEQTLLRILDVEPGAALEALESKLDLARLREARSLLPQMPAAPSSKEKLAALVTATQPAGCPELRAGVSPRGAQAWLRCARVNALLSGRYNVADGDLRATLLPALRHRVVLSYEAEADGQDPDALLQRLAGRIL